MDLEARRRPRTRSPGADFDALLSSFRRAVGAQLALFGAMENPATQDGDRNETATIRVSPGSGTWAGEAAERRVMGLVRRAATLPSAAIEPLPLPRGAGGAGSDPDALTHAVLAPVRLPHAVAGALIAEFTSAPSDAERTLWIAEGYAALFGLAVGSPQALEGLLQSEAIDGLTGCRTYQSVLRRLEREINRSTRNGEALSCCFIDLDGFKQVNDVHGHMYGNHVLREVGSILLRAVRSFDTVGRYGGDEFVAIFPQTTEREAKALARRLQRMITAATSSSLRLPLTASVGVAEWTPGVSAEQLLELADRALYAAKGAVITHR